MCLTVAGGAADDLDVEGPLVAGTCRVLLPGGKRGRDLQGGVVGGAGPENALGPVPVPRNRFSQTVALFFVELFPSPSALTWTLILLLLP